MSTIAPAWGATGTGHQGGLVREAFEASGRSRGHREVHARLRRGRRRQREVRPARHE